METDKGSVKVSVPVPEKSSRALAVATLLFTIPKMILLIPHLIVLWALGIAAVVIGVFAQVVVLITGKYPVTMHRFVVGVLRWQVRVNAYLFGLRDEYPHLLLRNKYVVNTVVQKRPAMCGTFLVRGNTLFCYERECFATFFAAACSSNTMDVVFE